MTNHDDAASLLARAFQEDPFISWAEPDAGRRHRTMATVFAGMLRFAARVGGHLFEPGVGSVHWRDGRAALLHGWDVARSGTWKVAFVTPPTVWGRLSAHEDAAMKCVQGLLTPRAVYLCTLVSVRPTAP